MIKSNSVVHWPDISRQRQDNEQKRKRFHLYSIKFQIGLYLNCWWSEKFAPSWNQFRGDWLYAYIKFKWGIWIASRVSSCKVGLEDYKLTGFTFTLLMSNLKT